MRLQLVKARLNTLNYNNNCYFVSFRYKGESNTSIKIETEEKEIQNADKGNSVFHHNFDCRFECHENPCIPILREKPLFHPEDCVVMLCRKKSTELCVNKEEKRKKVDMRSPQNSKINNFGPTEKIESHKTRTVRPKVTVKICGFTYNTKATKTKLCKSRRYSQGYGSTVKCKEKRNSVDPSNLILCKTVATCAFTCNRRGMKNATCKPIRLPPKYCNKVKQSTNCKKLDPCKVKVKKKATCSKSKYEEPKNLKPCEAHKPVPGEHLQNGVSTSSCSFDVYLCRKRKKLIPKVVISKGNIDFMSDLSGNILPTVKCKLCKQIRSENDVLFSVECSSKPKKQRTKRCKSKPTNAAGINLSMDPHLASAPEKRKGMNKKLYNFY